MAVGVSCLQPRNASEAVTISAARVTALLGCYRLLELDGRLIESAAYNLSNRIRLDAARSVDSLRYPGAERHRQLARRSPRLSPPPRADDTEDLAPSWEIIPTGDTLELSFHNGYSGSILRLASPDGRADTLRGLIAQHWDFPPYLSSQRGAMAARESCEADRASEAPHG